MKKLLSIVAMHRLPLVLAATRRLPCVRTLDSFILGEGSSDKFEIALGDEGDKVPSLHLVQGKFPTLNNNSAKMHRYSRN